MRLLVKVVAAIAMTAVAVAGAVVPLARDLVEGRPGFLVVAASVLLIGAAFGLVVGLASRVLGFGGPALVLGFIAALHDLL